MTHRRAALASAAWANDVFFGQNRQFYAGSSTTRPLRSESYQLSVASNRSVPPALQLGVEYTRAKTDDKGGFKEALTVCFRSQEDCGPFPRRSRRRSHTSRSAPRGA